MKWPIVLVLALVAGGLTVAAAGCALRLGAEGLDSEVILGRPEPAALPPKQ